MKESLANYIDHTLLNPDATKQDINQLLEEARTNDFYAICIHPFWISYCYQKLKKTDINICTVIGFPLGSTLTEVKVFETRQAIVQGASEVDMVMNIGAFKSNDEETVKDDIKSVVEAAGEKAIVKVIIETSLLSEAEIVRACQLAKEANAQFVKTSTGFSGGGATVADIQLMHKTVGTDIGVKASGGISDRNQALALIQAGALRIGTSSGVDLLKK